MNSENNSPTNNFTADKWPAVCVVMPTYNGKTRGFIDKAIQSILKQTLAVKQILLIDDGSTDGTIEYLMAKYPELEIHTKLNGGPSSARNYSLPFIKAEFVCFLDDDDEWVNTKIEHQVQYFRDHPDVDLLMSGMVFINSKSVKGNEVYPGEFGHTYPESLLGNGFLPPSTLMFRHTLIQKVGSFNENYRLGEDYEYCIRCTQHGKIALLKEVNTLYRVHDSQSCLDLQKIDKNTLSLVGEFARKNSPELEQRVHEYYILGLVCRALVRKEFAFAWKHYRSAHIKLKLLKFILRLTGVALTPFYRLKQCWRTWEYARVLKK